MLVTVLLLGLLLTALMTDLRCHKIYNWTTYPGILLAIGANALAAMLGFDLYSIRNDQLGLIGISDSLIGFVSCGLVMLACYVFFPGGVGGGDVKLVAMMGSFLGPLPGIEAMLWTFVLGGCLAVIMLIWRYGAWRVLTEAARTVWITLRFRVRVRLSDEERAPLKIRVLLSPSALVAVCIVQLPLLSGR